MKKILTAAQMRSCDEKAIFESGIPSRTLMDRAARACVEELSDFDLTKTVVLCGSGNNGGDGMAIADILASSDVDVTVVFAGDEEKCTPECAFRLRKLRETGVRITSECDFKGATAVVDALFGIGLSRPAAGNAARYISAANDCGAPILSVDVPSGLFADSGVVPGEAIRAKRTVAIQNLKPCHVFYPAADEYCGEIRVADIGITDDDVRDALTFVTDDDLAQIHSRPEHSNKGTFGRVLVIAGCEGMAGAAYLSALASYRSGAGLVEVFTVEANRTVIQTLLPEAVVTVYRADNVADLLADSLKRASAVVCGPGLGISEMSRGVVKLVLERCSLPLILDADALNIIARDKLTIIGSGRVTVTPHLGEMSRLTGMTVPQIAADLVSAARDFAAKFGVICVLKDAHTVISDGEETVVNLSGSAAMAKGGSGDVLTGVIAALSAFMADPFRAAYFGCYLHGRAGERAAKIHGIHGVLAREIADAIRR